jgi:Protein of unknown function (DUF3551)
MRMLRWVMVAGVTILVVAPAKAQRYDPRYPVCLQIWEWGGSSSMDCSFTSWDVCRATASGLSGMCLNNPYWSRARQVSPADRRRGRLY